MLKKTSRKRLIYIVITLVALFVIVYADTYSLYNTAIENTRVKELEEQKQELIQDIQESKNKIERIKVDKQVIEKVARERLHMKKENEDVYIIRRDEEKK
ncbi:MAG: FtsB family cell division protein [Bacteroidales bacterium]